MTPRRALLLLVLVAACSRNDPPKTAPVPAAPRPAAAPGALRLADRWERRVSVIREDSIVISAANGSRQLERRGRTAVFAMALAPGGGITFTLESLDWRPSAPVPSGLVGTTWSGKIDARGRITALSANRRSSLADELATTLRDVIPPIAQAGVMPGSIWRDSEQAKMRIGAFDVRDDRSSTWRAGERTARGVPVTVRETYEQLGTGDQAGRAMTMTAQGVRTGTWYLTANGEIESAMLSDSSANLVTIKGTRQAIPATEFHRTTIRYEKQ